MHTFTVFLLAAAAVGAVPRYSGYDSELSNEIPEMDMPPGNMKGSYYKKPIAELNSIEIGQQRGKYYAEYIDIEARTTESIPIDERGNVWISDEMRTTPKPYLEIPWLDQKLYKRIKANSDFAATLMRSILRNSYRKYGFKIIVDDPVTGPREKDVIYDVDEELAEIANSLARDNSKSKNGLEDAKKNKKRTEEMDPRQIRQNSVSKTKTLVAEDLDSLRTGLANKEYRLPVSLIPANLRWLKVVTSSVETFTDKSNENSKPKHTVYDPLHPDPADTLYGAALVTVFAAATTMAVIAFAYGWYSMVKRAKAAADVEYPAYGVTGPSGEGSADRRLAHSAQIFHYQHQKQQIMAMERLNEADEVGQILSPERLMPIESNGLETSHGSISDPDSEEERAEGDYTVYECPGFATTGDMEVKNPMFTEDPTPATPGKCELVHPQPKE